MDMLPSRVDKSVLAFDTAEGGKPYFNQSNIRFNLSHSKGYVACCVSDEGDVGVDIEASIIPSEKAKKLANRYFSADEIIAVEKSPESFTRLWSENEAKAKFLGKDLAMFFKENKQKNITANKRQNVYFHRFKAYNIPITVCTDSQHSTILFKIIK
jgi:4'-phosphopantetheinyl transferase